jgi:transposase InsO family protein
LLEWLTLVDEYTRECLALLVDQAVSGADKRSAPAKVLGRRAAPKRIRSDNGSQLIAEASRRWLPQQRTDLNLEASGSLHNNDYLELFNSCISRRVPGARVFQEPTGRQRESTRFRRAQNRVRPHSSLGSRPPKEFSDGREVKKNDKKDN